jgi:hypothetical protein
MIKTQKRSSTENLERKNAYLVSKNPLFREQGTGNREQFKWV